jgi:hypothetical protein
LQGQKRPGRRCGFERYGPNKTLCMIRPGTSVNSPATTKAPEKIKIMMRR